MTDEGELVRRCLTGDPASAREFVERFQNAIFGLCYRMLGHRQDAEDVSQEVFLRALRNLARWDAARPLKPWLFTIAANRCRTALGNRSKLATPASFCDDLPAAEVRGQEQDLAEEVQRALAAVRPEYRLCFVLFHEQELSCAEIGEILQRPEGTIKTWLHRVRRELAEALRRRGIGLEHDHELHRI